MPYGLLKFGVSIVALFLFVMKWENQDDAARPILVHQKVPKTNLTI
jgi:hypothetical protein